MNIREFISKIGLVKQIENNSGDFSKPEFDSRKIQKGDLFIAIKGSLTDGHKYINDVIKNGCSVVVCEELPESPNKNIYWLQVKSSSKALSVIASCFYNKPSNKIKLIGITGTNGKTTIATSLHNLVMSLGYSCGLISTNNIKINNVEYPTSLTTPDSLRINQVLSDMLDKGCEYCFMEVSSHAVAQDRIFNLDFDAAVFTNITHDHLDYHENFNDYLNAKKLLFDELSNQAFALVNKDDKHGMTMIQNTNAKKYSYSLKSPSDYKAMVLEKHFDGMLLNLNSTELWTKFIGEFNAYNILAVYGVAELLGFDQMEVLKAISELDMVEGRFEAIKSKNNITSIIDYAHTPDALENVLKTINDIRGGDGILFTVVGCGGDRDKEKRPIMASIATKYSDKVILTSDNPRTEKPEDIIEDMKKGIRVEDRKKIMTITDRKEAIRVACLNANSKDIILVSGKGHEKYQEINGVKYDFDDKKIICETFNELT